MAEGENIRREEIAPEPDAPAGDAPRRPRTAGLGRISLVGAGPGDPELLTLKAVRVLAEADVVLHDDLVSREVLAHCPAEATLIRVGKRGGRPSFAQSAITALAVSEARAGKRVVRLKGGDPLVFGRADEEIAAAEEAGVPVEIVSGVTAAFAAAASLALPLTKRGVARRVQFVTAHAREGAVPEDLDVAALCDPAATTCVYMGLSTLEAFVALLLAGGLPPSTPVVVVERASLADQREVRADLAGVTAAVEAAGLVGPCVTLIGAAMQDRDATGPDPKGQDPKGPDSKGR
jgi:uroporphyrin-III C-methyltransferase/precorrin-2 dehydrogenase/sirohydrochlorin ferrochelatase